jgi:hypothetical protein
MLEEDEQKSNFPEEFQSKQVWWFLKLSVLVVFRVGFYFWWRKSFYG